MLILDVVGLNQGVIMSKGGARLLANVASKTDDPQTLRMVAGAIANLCGNGTAIYLYLGQVFNEIMIIWNLPLSLEDQLCTLRTN